MCINDIINRNGCTPVGIQQKCNYSFKTVIHKLCYILIITNLHNNCFSKLFGNTKETILYIITILLTLFIQLYSDCTL